MKRTLLLLMLAIAVVGCKKSNTTPQYDLAGTWVLSSTNLSGQLVTAADYPCIANFKLIFNTGSSATVNWKYNGTCVTDPSGHTTFSGTDGLILNFSRNGNNLYLRQSSTSAATYGTITSVDGKLQLTLRDTVTIHYDSGTTTTYNSNLYIKQ